MRKLLCHWPFVVGSILGVMVTQMTLQSYEYHSTRFKQMVGHKAVLKTTGETVTIIDRDRPWPCCVGEEYWEVQHERPEDHGGWRIGRYREQVLDVKY